MKKIVFTFGRFQPVTQGHIKLINKAVDYANQSGAEHRIYASKSHDKIKNPIPYENKLGYLKQIAPHANIVHDPQVHSAFDIAGKLSRQGYDDVTMIAGSDRVKEFRKSIGNYVKNRSDPDFDPEKHFAFKKWNVVSAGHRDANRDGVEGISGTKMRNYARKGNLKAFAKGVPTTNLKLIKSMFRDVRNNLKEEIDHKKFGPMLDSFVSFAARDLGLKSYPSIKYKEDQGEQPSFASYNPSTNEIAIVTKHRHPMDILRSICHELVHHKQNEQGRIKNVAREGSTGSKIENEANSIAGIVMRKFGKANPDYFNLQHVNESDETEDNIQRLRQHYIRLDSPYLKEETLQEGVLDPATHTAVFLMGGPGSGKDHIMHRTLMGHGLTEINSDHAFEYLMDKHGLDKKMPPEQSTKRNLIRGRSLNIVSEKQRLAMAGRQGLIINSTASDPEGIATLKKQLEDIGYKSMAVFVHASNNISKQRNEQRGAKGGRMVPENIRSEKWHSAQKAKPLYAQMFGDKFIHVDNSHDYHKISDNVRKKIDDEHLNIYRAVRRFTTTPTVTPQAIEWRNKASGTLGYKQPRAHMGFNRTTPVHKGVRQQFLQTKINNQFEQFIQESAVELEPSKREWGTDSLANLYKNGTPGQSISDMRKYYAFLKSRENSKTIGKSDLDHVVNEARRVSKKQTTSREETPLGFEFGNNRIGPTTKDGTGNAIGMSGTNFSISMTENVRKWMEDPKTKQKYREKYGDFAEHRLLEAARKLSITPKTLDQIREYSSGKGPEDKMGTVPSQNKEEF